MKYEEEINAAFARLGFNARSGQAKAVNDIVTAFLDEGMSDVVVSASTGTGKSIIGAVTAEVISAIAGNKDGACSAISLTANNLLAKQYEATFSTLGHKFAIIKGANNYPCTALTTIEEQVSAEDCAFYTMVKSGEFKSVIAEHCDTCEYIHAKRRKNAARHVSTNYSYFFVDRMYIEGATKFAQRDLLVWDEAHLINDLFSEHNAIFFSEKRLRFLQKDIAETLPMTDLKISKTLNQVAVDCTKKGKIDETNYRNYLRALMEVYAYARDEGTKLAEKALRSSNMKSYTRYSRFSKKYEGLFCKIDDLFNYEYDHVVDISDEEQSVAVKPIFVSKMFDTLKGAVCNLFMSATISGEFLQKTLGLDPATTKFIKLPPSFPKENKEIVFFDCQSLSYNSLKDAQVISKLRSNVAKIVSHHVSQNQRGIILTPSFKLQDEIVNELKNSPDFKSYRLFEQRKGEKLVDILEAFKSYNGGPAVMITPSGYEGVDLPGDLSRFQIMVKAPFPSLGDKRFKYILDAHPDLYNFITVSKLVQGAGRSVRSADDHATTYVLDSNAQRLWNSRHNIWQDEFNTRYTRFL